MIFQGRCHCGNLTVTFETLVGPEALPLRVCTCTFCRAHAPLYTSDPNGAVKLGAREPERLSRYVFALGTAEMWICARCGVYTAAVMRDGDRAYATLNVRCLDDAALFTAKPEPVSYDAEDVEKRRARRRSRWIPVRELSSA